MLYEGIPEFEEKVLDGMSELATYSSLFLGSVAGVCLGGYWPVSHNAPAGQFADSCSIFNQSLYCSMAFHTIVVLITVLFRITTVGHMRDSDILIMLWKAQWVPTVSTVMFLLGTVASMISLLWALVMLTMLGSHCFAGNPSMTWDLWWDEWTGDHRDYPVGRGVAHPDGEYILNPWAQKADELGIVLRDSDSEPNST